MLTHKGIIQLKLFHAIVQAPVPPPWTTTAQLPRFPRRLLEVEVPEGLCQHQAHFHVRYRLAQTHGSAKREGDKSLPHCRQSIGIRIVGPALRPEEKRLGEVRLIAQKAVRADRYHCPGGNITVDDTGLFGREVTVYFAPGHYRRGRRYAERFVMTARRYLHRGTATYLV